MTATQQATALQVTVTQEVLPPGHASHGTPDAVVKRVFKFSLPQGEAQVDQTDYGHPGKMNPCYPQVVPMHLTSKTSQLLAAAEALAALL